jgi:magnesium transporter
MLPSMFYGLYGMNVQLPFQHNPWAFIGLNIFVVLVNILVIAIARKKRIF